MILTSLTGGQGCQAIWRRLAPLWVLASSTGTPSLASAGLFDAQMFQLSNGMQVVCIPDHRAPVVTHMLWYRVGSADETPGKSGLAHFFEHLMFKGTTNRPGDAYARLIGRAGARRVRCRRTRSERCAPRSSCLSHSEALPWRS